MSYGTLLCNLANIFLLTSQHHLTNIFYKISLCSDGMPHHTLANELVPGDIVTFSTGDRIPSDIRIIDAIDLEIDESSLTGETEGRRKTTHPCGTPSTPRFVNGDGAAGTSAGAYGLQQAKNQNFGHEPIPLAERTCIAYMGTLVRNGRGTGIVIATGTETEFGVIFSMMQDVSPLFLLAPFTQINHFLIGRGTSDPPATIYGRTRQKAFHHLLRYHWCHRPYWRVAATRVARYVYYRRFVSCPYTQVL